ncbi:MAG: DUF3014 domain-containing protein [Desulfuromusa sp.]|nr:DUF3014 domain-containing protein [Desulfuromusa sp.]
MKKINLLIFALIVLISALALTMLLQQAPDPEPVVKESPQKSVEKPAKQAIVHYPVPAATAEPAEEIPEEKPQQVSVPDPILPKQLPSVEQSDKSIEEVFTSQKLDEPLFKLLLLENFIQRVVVSIDNLPEKRLPRAHLPLTSPKGRFIVSGTAEAPQTSSRNQDRYNVHVQLLEALDPEFVLKTYVYFYPLFQKAYEQLGYRNAYFNDRLVYVIDHLLETPETAEPMLLSQPAILYTYADPLLEKLSSGQKTLLRIGPKHRQKMKAVLNIYRDKLINLRP